MPAGRVRGSCFDIFPGAGHWFLGRRKRTWPSFPLPENRGSVTAAEVIAAEPGPERNRAIHAWCVSVWESYRESHQAVAELLKLHGVI